MGKQIVHVFDLVDGDPVTVDRYNNTGVGAEFTIDGVTTMVPWGQVTRVRRADRQALRDYADSGEGPAAIAELADAVDYKPGDPEEDPPEVVPGADTTIVIPPDGDAAEGGPVDSEGNPPGVTRAGAGQEQVGEEPEKVDALKTDTDPTGASKAREFGGNATNADMRAWAKENGVDVSESGPVSKSVATAYAAAHAG